MKTKTLTKTAIFLALIMSITASVSASKIQYNTDGIMNLPTFYVYASDEEGTQEATASTNGDWTFEKSLDSEGRVEIEVALPSGENVTVYTPGISTSLVKS